MSSPAPRSPDDEPTLDASTLRSLWTRRAFGLLLALIAAGYGMDVLFLGHFEPWTLGLRLGWMALLVGLYREHATPARERLATYAGVLVSGVCCVGLAFRVGGLGSPYFAVVLMLPPTVGIALVFQGRRGPIWWSGAVCLLGTVLLVWRERRPMGESAAWLVAVVLVTLLADVLARGVLRLLQSEEQVRVERSRRENLEALAQSEHRRAHSEKLAIVGRLASGVAHEINNPLAYVDANVDFVREELLASREVDREQLADLLAETHAGLQHIRQIVADLQGFARMDAQEPSACSLVDVVADAMKLGSLRLRHVAWLRVDVPVELPEIVIVRQRLVQVVLNLLVNAGDALEAHQVQGGEILVTGRAEAQRVVLLIEDNGPGFAPPVLARLFEPFFTTKSVDKGTGLGLNLSRELVQQFGGTLTASNRPQGGARLRLELPCRPAAHLPPAQAEPEHAA